MTTFCVFDRGGYVVRACLPMDDAARLATLVGGTVAPMQVRTPLERLRESLGVLQRSDLPPALLWFVEEAQQAGEELGATIRQERAK